MRMLTVTQPLEHGPDVLAVQKRLAELGYNPGPLDSQYGTLVRKAVEAFQHDQGLKVDGVVGPATESALTHAKPLPTHPSPPLPKPGTGAAHRADLRAAVVKAAESLDGIHEIPDGSNNGPDVHRIQSVTGAYGEPWCVSTVQYEDHLIGLPPYADDTANAYYYADFATKHGHTVPHPVPGAAVVYRIGAGHIGRVKTVNADGTFVAEEGNEGNAVRAVTRDPRTIGCTFVLRPELAL